MERFCDELRLERERRNVSIDEICAVTKVAPRHLHALEAGEYRALPGGVFRKGIVRGYLKVLELDEVPWIERFEASLRESGEEEPDSEDWAEFAENVRRNRGGAAFRVDPRWMGIVMMIITLVVLGWSVWKFVLHGKFL
jgi:cytoskeleton protein RodZ